MKNVSSYTVLFARDYRTMALGRQGAPYFRRYGRELVSKPAISLKKGWGGYRRTIQFLNAGKGHVPSSHGKKAHAAITLLMVWSPLRESHTVIAFFFCEGQPVPAHCKRLRSSPTLAIRQTCTHIFLMVIA